MPGCGPRTTSRQLECPDAKHLEIRPDTLWIYGDGRHEVEVLFDAFDDDGNAVPWDCPLDVAWGGWPTGSNPVSIHQHVNHASVLLEVDVQTSAAGTVTAELRNADGADDLVLVVIPDGGVAPTAVAPQTAVSWATTEYLSSDGAVAVVDASGWRARAFAGKLLVPNTATWQTGAVFAPSGAVRVQQGTPMPTPTRASVDLAIWIAFDEEDGEFANLSAAELDDKRRRAKQAAEFDAEFLQAMLDHWDAGVVVNVTSTIVTDPVLISKVREAVDDSPPSGLCSSPVLQSNAVNAYYTASRGTPLHWDDVCPEGVSPEADVIFVSVFHAYNTLAHEFGHALGLNDQYSDADFFERNNIMLDFTVSSFRNRLTVGQLFRINWDDSSMLCRLGRLHCVTCVPATATCPPFSEDFPR